MINDAINDAINENLQSQAQQALSYIGMDVGELEEILHECNGTIKQSVYFGTSHEGEKIYVEMECRLPNYDNRCPCGNIEHLEETLGLASTYYERIVTSRSRLFTTLL